MRETQPIRAWMVIAFPSQTRHRPDWTGEEERLCQK